MLKKSSSSSRPLMLPDGDADALVAGLAHYDSPSRAETLKILGDLINPQTVFVSRTGELYDPVQAFDIRLILDAIYQRKMAYQSKSN